jgi:hypothetical protein
MNQRIQEIAEQAKKHALDTMIKIADKQEALKIYSESYDRKFAELIIDECCSELLDMDKKANGNHNYYKYAAIEIKRSFE